MTEDQIKLLLYGVPAFINLVVLLGTTIYNREQISLKEFVIGAGVVFVPGVNIVVTLVMIVCLVGAFFEEFGDMKVLDFSRGKKPRS